jgi:hypothetical protein
MQREQRLEPVLQRVKLPGLVRTPELRLQQMPAKPQVR